MKKVEQDKGLYVLVNWIDNGEEWVRPSTVGSLPSAEEMCLKHTGEPSSDNLDYHLVMDDDEQVYALITIPSDLPESQITTEDGIDFMPLDYAMENWGCMHSLIWSKKDKTWTHL